MPIHLAAQGFHSLYLTLVQAKQRGHVLVSGVYSTNDLNPISLG